jgi:hypothetical protein
MEDKINALASSICKLPVIQGRVWSLLMFLENLPIHGTIFTVEANEDLIFKYGEKILVVMNREFVFNVVNNTPETDDILGVIYYTLNCVRAVMIDEIQCRLASSWNMCFEILCDIDMFDYSTYPGNESIIIREGIGKESFCAAIISKGEIRLNPQSPRILSDIYDRIMPQARI